VCPPDYGDAKRALRRRLWYAVRRAAKLHDVRLHDLRHSYACSCERRESILVLTSCSDTSELQRLNAMRISGMMPLGAQLKEPRMTLQAGYDKTAPNSLR